MRIQRLRSSVRALVPPAAALALLSALAGPALGGSTAHSSGGYGVHALIDLDEAPGAACAYDGTGGLDRVVANPPVAYARDRSPNVDSQWLRWRFRILGYTPSASAVPAGAAVVARSAWRYDYTNERTTAEFRQRSLSLPADAGYQAYVVDIIVQWMKPGTKTTVAGFARHTITKYEYWQIYAAGPPPGWGTDCRASLTASVAGIVASHEGAWGRHALVDEPVEYAGAACRYEDFQLRRISVRPPAAFARDRSLDLDSQWLRWRFVIEGLNGPGWSEVHRSTWSFATATEWRGAAFTRRSFEFTAATYDDYPEYRVAVLVQWLWPQKSSRPAEGAARHLVEWYDYGSSASSFQGVCTAVD